MNTLDRALRLKLIEPAQPVRVSMGGSFTVTVQVVTTRVTECKMHLAFDATFVEDISGKSDPRHLHGEERITQEVSWRLRAKSATRQTFITVEGHAEGIFQQVEFPLEVTQ